MLVATALAAAACGSSGAALNQPSPSVPLNLTVYVDDSRVSLSPDSVGAGPLVFIVTNQASSAQTLTLLPAGDSAAQPLAATGPINPQGTAQLKVDLGTPGDYVLTTGAGAPPGTTAAATLHVGQPRPSGSNDLLQP
jgi:hypothetical protein